MNSRFLAIVGKVVTAGALVTGFAAVAAQGASALSSTTYFVSTHALDSTTVCTQAQPCTLNEAVLQEASQGAGASGNTIFLENGTYTETSAAPGLSALASGNNHVVVKGQNPKKTIVTGDGTVTSILNLMSVQGVNVQKLTLSGTSAQVAGTVSGSGGTVAQPDVLSGVNVTGSSSAPSTAVLLAAGNTDLNGTNVTGGATKPCVAKVAISPINFTGWTAGPGSILTLKKVPACEASAFSGSVQIGANTYTATLSGNFLTLTSSGSPTAGVAIAPKATVNFRVNTNSAYNAAGITIAGASTSVTMNAGSVVGSNTYAATGGGANGILVTNSATAVIGGVSVTGNICSPGTNPTPCSAPGAGITIAPGPAVPSTVVIGNPSATPAVAGNNVSGNDVGVLAEGGGSGTSNVTISGNGTISANQAGIAAVGVTPAQFPTFRVTGNNISNTLLGVGVELEGSVGVTIGGVLASPNTISGNGVGVAIGELTSGACAPIQASGADSVTYNKITGNQAMGVEVAGPATPAGLSGSCGAPSATQNFVGPNTVSNDTFSSNGTGSLASGANIADFDAWVGPGGSPSVGSLTYNGTVPAALGSSISLPLAVTGTGTVLQGDGLHVSDTTTGAFGVGTIYVTSGANIAGPSTISSAAISSTFLVVANAVPANGGFNVGDTFVISVVSPAGVLASPDTVVGSNSTPANTPVCGALSHNAGGVPLTAATGTFGGFFDC